MTGQIGNFDLTADQFMSHLRAALESQIENCEIYRYMCAKRDFSPERDLLQPGDEVKVPYITSNAFKKSRGIYERLVTVPLDTITHWTVSSGTTGDQSYVGRRVIEMDSYRLAYRTVLADAAGRGSYDETLLFFPDPDDVIGKGGQLYQGAIEPFGVYVGYEAGDISPSAVRRYLPQWNGERQDFVVDTHDLFERLRALEAEEKSVYLGGAPAIMLCILRQHEETGETFAFGERCKIQFGNGGWERVQSQLGVPQDQVKRDLVNRLCAVLGIVEPTQIDDSYGSTETPAALAGHFSSEYGDFIFHQPPWMRLIVRNPQSLEPVTKAGERGLLQVVTPYGAGSFSGVAILIDDVAELVTRDGCPECGRSGVAVRIVGRAVDTSGASQGCGAIVGA